MYNWFPFVTRSHHEEVVREIKDRLDESISRAEMLQRALHRVHDSGFLGQYGFQVYDSLPKTEGATQETEHEPTADEKEQDQLEAEHGAEKRRLASLRRTSPSRLGPELARLMAKDLANRAASAHPAAAVFEAARTTALGRTGKA
jgi:hypothetical protein